MTAVEYHPGASVPADADPRIVDFSAADLRARLDDALGVYVAAMDYPPGTARHRAPTWTEHTSRPGWRSVAALLPDADDRLDARAAPIVAIAYGYRGAPHQWWHQQVHNGMRRTGWSARETHELLGNYFEVTELHVHPHWQGRGLGERLLSRLLTGRPERAALLSTPEIADEGNRAWRLYRRFGFTDVIRRFTFAGDRRPFAILRCPLPPTHPGLWNPPRRIPR
ncbi:MAG: GNAT family N-acetyltransferase [Mycobacteriaceae bacterium]|nr:GNAT family N-acetyltransferase [Mycobacteriaceae bacterium]